METFSIKFPAENLNLSAIVTEYNHPQKFKVEMVIKEPEPVLLTRPVEGEWTVGLLYSPAYFLKKTYKI